MIGKYSRLQIKSSVIGRNCKIGSGVRIEGAYLWDNVVIEDGVSITASIICDNARVGQKSIIGKGCILSFNVCFGAYVIGFVNFFLSLFFSPTPPSIRWLLVQIMRSLHSLL